MADVNSTFSYNANFGPAQAQIRALTKDISSLNAAFLSLDQNANARKSSLAQGFMKDLGALGGFKTQVVDLTSDVERFGKALQKNQLTLRQYYKEAAQAYKKNSMARRLAEDEVRRAQSQLVGMGSDMQGRKKGMLITPLSIDTSDINTKMAIAQKQFSIFNKLVSDGATQLINWGKNTQWAGRQLTVGLTVPLTIFGATVSKTFREVDKELTRFAKVYGSDLVGANKAATDTMRAQVEQLSKDFAGKYGIAARETAGLAADLAATGLEGQKLLDSVAQTTRLAVLGEVDRQEAMKATLALQNAFNMSTGELADSINFLNAVENQTSASLQDLTEAIPRVGPVINALGGDVKDLAVLLVAMKEGGVNAAEGANAIKSGLASLINPTKQAAATAQQYGIDIKGIVAANKGQLMPTLIAFQSQLKNLDDFAKAQIIEQLFGKYQFARISALFDNLNASGSQTVEVMKLMGASSQELATIANGEIRTLTESSAMRFQRSMEAIKASLLPVGQVLTDAVIPFLEKTASVINTIVEYAKNLPEPVKNFLKLSAGFTLIAGPIIMLAGVLGNFLGYLNKGAMLFTRLGAAMAGLKTEKFELLDDNQLAAAKSSDILAATYNNQTASLARLNGALTTYIANLRETQRVQPNVFATGAPSAGRGKPPLRKQAGGEAFVPGSGSGDRIPAMLEPGEYVVNKKAAQQNKSLLNYINFTSAPRFINGGEVPGYNNLISDIGLNANNKSRDPMINWIDSTLSKITDPKEAKSLIDNITKEIAKNKKYTMDVFKGDWNPVTSNGRKYSSRTTRSGIRTGSPSKILAMKTEREAALQQDLLSHLRKNQKSLGLTDAQIIQMSTIDAAHLVPEVKNGVKIFRPSNLTWIPGVENKGLQYLSGKNNKKLLEQALLSAASYDPATDKQYVDSILSGGHPAGGKGRKLLLEAFASLENNKDVSPKARTWIAATNSLLRNKIYDVRDERILPSTDPNFNTGYRTKTRNVDGTRANPEAINSHKTDGRPVKVKNIPSSPYKPTNPDDIIEINAKKESIVDKKFMQKAQSFFGIGRYRTRIAEEGLGDESDIKAQRRAVRGQKAGAIGGLAMTGAFMLPALTGTNEALNGFTSALTNAMMALSVLTTIAQVRGIGSNGPGRMSQVGQYLGGKSARLQTQGGLEKTFSGGSKRLLAQGTAKQGLGLLGRGAAAMMGGGAALMIPLAAIAAGVAAFALYQKSIQNARKEGEALYAEQTKAAEYYGIELKSLNSIMAENAQLAKDMGLAKDAIAVSVDPALKKAILDQEENKKLVEQIKSSNDPAAIFLGQYGKMLQQGFSVEQAKEILSVLAQASGKMGALQGIAGTISSTVVMGKNGEVDANATAIKATETVGAAAIKNIESLFSTSVQGVTSQKFTDPNTGKSYNTVSELEAAMGGRVTTVSRSDYEAASPQERAMGRYGIIDQTMGTVTTSKPLTSEPDFANLQGQISEVITAALMSPDLGVGYEAMSKTIEATFKKGIETGTSEAEIASSMGESAKQVAKELGFEEDSQFVKTLNSALNDTTDKAKGAKDQFLLVQAATAGIDLSDIIADGKALGDEMKIVAERVAAFETQKQINITINANIQEGLNAIDAEIQARTAYYDGLIIANEQAQDAENERTKNFQKNMEKRNKALQKEIKGIQRSADETIDQKEKEIEVLEKSTKSYLDSLQSKKDESSFLSQQGQTALGGLGALAGGDVVGFLAAQEQMASDANAYAQQSEIDRIQEIADAETERLNTVIDSVREKTEAEVQALQDQIDKNQELMDGEGERHEKRMENLQKEAQKIQTDKAAELGRLNDTKAKLEELMALPVGEKLGKDLGKYAAGISEVAANMPKSAQDTMSKLARSFGDNFQSVFDAELQKSASEYGVDPTNLKALIQKALPGKASSNSANVREDRVATGGYIQGPGTANSDSIPARLSNGEYVVRASAVKKIGRQTLDQINNGIGGMSGRTSTTEGYRVGGDEAPAAAAAFAGGVKTVVEAVNAGNALALAAASAMDEEPGNDKSPGTGSPTTAPEKMGPTARILRGNYRVTARGTYPKGGKHRARYDTAIDYGTPRGTEVYAMAAGKLGKSYSGDGYGKFATIGHNDGTESLYAHLDGYASNNRNVSAGDLIGYTGNTGRTSGPHLHFEWSALKEGFNPPGMRIGGETMSDGLAKLHKGEMVLTKPLTQTLKEGISDLRVGVPAMASTSGIDAGGTMVSDNRVINVNVNASGSNMNPDMVAQRIVSAINKQESRRNFGRSS